MIVLHRHGENKSYTAEGTSLWSMGAGFDKAIELSCIRESSRHRGRMNISKYCYQIIGKLLSYDKRGSNDNFMFCTHFLHFFTFVIKLFSYNHYGFALLLISFPEISSTFLILPTPWPTFLLKLHFTSLSTPILLSYIPSTISSFFFFSSIVS